MSVIPRLAMNPHITDIIPATARRQRDCGAGITAAPGSVCLRRVGGRLQELILAIR